jgi:valyl-tRNA synthetase
METLIALITKVRSIRSTWNVPPQSRLKLCVATANPAFRELIGANQDQIQRLARVEQIDISDGLPRLEGAARDIVAGMEIAVPLEGLIDLDKERERITREMGRKENEARGLASRLDNVSFMERAPDEVVQQTRARHQELIAEIEKLRATLGSLGFS